MTARRSVLRHLVFIILIFGIVMALSGASGRAVRAQAPVIVQINLDGVVHPVMADYVRDGLNYAGAAGAKAVILRIDTPGGLVDSMREIVEAILDSPVPVITWTGPGGARAASAGFFILLAGDLAVMAPGTNTGAAHPVSLGGGALDPVMEKKALSDAAAYLRSIVAKRNRNVERAEQGVVESRSFTADEALKENLIDAVLNDVPAIVARFDGHDVRRFNDTTTRLALRDAVVEQRDMSAREQVLSRVLDPNLAFVLGMIGLLGLYFEMTHPGLIIPGVAGGISLILALFAFNLLPLSWTGAALIFLGITLFVLEATVTSHGILALGGIVSMVAGALMLVQGPIPELRIRLATTLAAALPLAIITVLLVRLVYRSNQLKSITGEDGMIGETGTALSDVYKDGRVFVHGEYWNALSSIPIKAGSRVRIVKRDGLKVAVEPVEVINGSAKDT